MKKNYIILLGVVLVMSCSNPGEDKEQVKPSKSIYNVEILYLNKSIDSAKHIKKIPSKTDLHLFFDEGFEHDSLFLYVNNELYCRKDLTTNPSTGNATYIELKEIDRLSSVSFRINNGRLCYTEVDKEKNVMIVTFLNKTLKAVFDDKVRVYD